MARPEALSTTQRLLAVLDTDAAAAEAADALRRSGVGDDDLTILHGEEGAARLSGRPSGWGRLKGFLSFIATDQAVDLATYQAALANGRVVVALRVPDAEERARAVSLLTGAGAHFLNYYGRFATEDIAGWRGSPPDVHWRYHR